MTNDLFSMMIKISCDERLSDLQAKLKDWIDESDYRNLYCTAESSRGIPGIEYSKLVNQATSMFFNLYLRDASDERLLNVLKYGVVVMNSMRYRLDCEKAYRDFIEPHIHTH